MNSSSENRTGPFWVFSLFWFLPSSAFSLFPSSLSPPFPLPSPSPSPFPPQNHHPTPLQDVGDRDDPWPGLLVRLRLLWHRVSTSNISSQPLILGEVVSDQKLWHSVLAVAVSLKKCPQHFELVMTTISYPCLN